MKLDFGHGFVPRIDKRNWTGVDSALGPPGRLPFEDPLDLAWGIVDLALAHRKPTVVTDLHAHGVKVLADSSAWRYRESSTFAVEAMMSLPYAPPEPIGTIGSSIADFVEAEIRHQEASQVDAYLIPGFVPRDKLDDVSDLTLTAIDAALRMTDLMPKPFIAYVGTHSEQPDVTVRLLDEISRSVEGVYLQITPFAPQTDSPSKIIRCAELARHASTDFTVIAGRAGGAGNLFRVLGVHATDAGLADGETFNFGSTTRARKPSESMKGKGTGRRLYVPPISMSVPGSVHAMLSTTPGLQHLVRCSLPCCRFNPLDTSRARAVEHSLRSRVEEASTSHGLPPSMRIERLHADLESKRSTLTTCNTVLTALGETPLRRLHLDNQIAALARLLARPNAA